MTSSKHNLAIHKWGNLKALVEFANMGDTTERWLAFQKRWPDVFPTEFYADSENELRRNAQRAKEPMRSKDAPWIYAMTSRGIAQRRSRPAGEGTWIDYAEPRILLLRDTLRRAWAGGPDAGRCMEELLGLRPFPGESLDDPSSGVSVDWHRASLAFSPRNEFEAACYALLQKSQLAKYCTNPECPAPYFVAKRAIQRYCSPDCLKPFQRQAKLDWWNRKGKARRSNRMKERLRNGQKKAK